MPTIETRRDLAQHLQGQMLAARGSGVASEGEEEEVPGRTSLKTYLLEAHCPDASPLLGLTTLGASNGFKVWATKDEDLFHLAKGPIDVWCDTSLGRFWRLHTTAPVKDADPFRDAMVGQASWLDHVWFSPAYLEAFPDAVGGEMLLFSLNHDRRPLNPTGRPFSESDYVSLRLWASKPSETLRKLRQGNVFPHGVSVRSVKLRTGDADSPDVPWCVAEYFHHGKITASGTSFDEHNRLILRALADYRRVVDDIEGRLGLAATTDASGHPVVTGNPVIIRVDWEVQDLKHAVGRMFASAEPFRLWGLPEEVAAGHYRARAADLHFGGVLGFDITAHEVVIQLPRGVCGNTVMRFLSSLRFHVNSDASDPA